MASDFNPLPRKEGDGDSNVSTHLSFSISIHSLVKRETFLRNDSMNCVAAKFQSTPS